jgi:regulatory protein
MKIEKIEPSKHKKGRILLFLEDGSLLKITEQELLDYGLRAGDLLDDATLTKLREAADGSNAKADAAALIGRRAMSRADLEKKLHDKGASAVDARYAAEWLEAIGALNDADYAALLVRHCCDMGYGPARYREELHKHGIPRELWEDALMQATEPSILIDRFLSGKLRDRADAREVKRASDALLRRGFRWNDIKDALGRYTTEEIDE